MDPLGFYRPWEEWEGKESGGCSCRASLLSSPAPVSVAHTHRSLEFLTFSAVRSWQVCAGFPHAPWNTLLFWPWACINAGQNGIAVGQLLTWNKMGATWAGGGFRNKCFTGEQLPYTFIRPYTAIWNYKQRKMQLGNKIGSSLLSVFKMQDLLSSFYFCQIFNFLLTFCWLQAVIHHTFTLVSFHVHLVLRTPKGICLCPKSCSGWYSELFFCDDVLFSDRFSFLLGPLLALSCGSFLKASHW